MVAQNLDEVHIRSRDSRSGDVVLAAKQVHSLDVKSGYVLAEVLYPSGLLDIDSRKPFQGILQGVVRPCGVSRDGIGKSVAELPDRRSPDNGLLKAYPLLFQGEVARPGRVFM